MVKEKLNYSQEAIVNYIIERQKLFNGEKKISEVLQNIGKNTATLDLGSSVLEVSDAIECPRIAKEEATLILTQELQQKILSNSIQYKEGVIPILETLDNGFLYNINGSYQDLRLLFSCFEFFLSEKYKKKDKGYDIYQFKTFTDFIEYIECGNEFENIENPKSLVQSYRLKIGLLEKFLQIPTVLTYQTFVLRSIARAIVYTNNVKVSSTNIEARDPLIQKSNSNHNKDQKRVELHHDRERQCYENFIQTTIFLPFIEEIRQSAEEEYEKDYPKVYFLLKSAERINKYSSYISAAYVIAIVSIFFTRTYSQFVGEDLARDLEKKIQYY